MGFMSTPKVEPPKIIPPATPPSQDEAMERVATQDRALYRRGRAATRLTGLSGSPVAGSGGQTAAFRLLSGAQ